MRVLAVVVAAVCFVAPAIYAQDGTLLRVAYVAVQFDATGAEELHSKGVHYIEANGRHRHDETFSSGETTSLYRLPEQGLNISVNHDLNVAVPSRLHEPPWNALTSRRVGSQPMFGFTGQLDDDTTALEGLDELSVAEPTHIGTRAHGPLLLTGYAYDVPGVDRMEVWMYEHPLGSSDMLKHPPIPIETSIAAPDGGRFVARVVAASRIAGGDAIFEIPYELPAARIQR